LGPVGLESLGPGSLVARQGRLQIAQADSQLPQRHRDRQQARRRASRLRAQRAQSSQCGEGPFGNECAITLTQAGMAAKKIAQCRVRRLGERQHRSERVGQRAEGKPAIRHHPLFLSGAIEVQDEGSQLLGLIVAPKRSEMVVDFCAGAGGKTLLLGAIMRSQGRLYAFDVSAGRLARLKPRLARSGLSNVQPFLLNDERDTKVKRLAGKIDRVLVDAPCSGFGTLRRNPDLKWRQMPEAIDELAAKQTRILNSAASLVKPGGRLVYATCSVLGDENEAIVDGFLASHPQFTQGDASAELKRANVALDTGAMLRLYPHVHGCDGFFAAILERAL
ncbi:MAG: RsmB/NOP family class I SAM-dependent RNA methyltransferase, partial [Betaproteobacteria bacterium]